MNKELTEGQLPRKATICRGILIGSAESIDEFTKSYEARATPLIHYSRVGATTPTMRTRSRRSANGYLTFKRAGWVVLVAPKSFDDTTSYRRQHIAKSVNEEENLSSSAL